MLSSNEHEMDISNVTSAHDDDKITTFQYNLNEDKTRKLIFEGALRIPIDCNCNLVFLDFCTSLMMALGSAVTNRQCSMMVNLWFQFGKIWKLFNHLKVFVN